MHGTIDSRRFRLLVAALVLAVGAIPLTHNVGTAQAQTATQMQFFGPDGSGFERFVDVGRKGYSPGDDSFFSVKLVDTSTEEVAGRAVGLCTAIVPSRTNTLQRCEFQVNLPTGSILAIASFRVAALEQGAPLAIAGGTGDYNDVAGTLTLTNAKRQGKTGALIDIELISHP